MKTDALRSLPIVVSITTLPSRIGDMRPALASLLDGDLVPDRIFVVVSDRSEREGRGYDIPDFLRDEGFKRGIVEVVTASRDWGPGTKLLGALEHLPDEAILVVADDDVAYHRSFLSTIVEAQSARHDRSFSYFTYRARGLTIGQGCDGFSFYTPNLHAVREFVEAHVVGTPLQYHDDLWISFFLFRQGVNIEALKLPSDGSTIYVQTIDDDGLRAIASGEHARDRIVSEGLPRLVRIGGLTTAQKLRLLAAQSRDWLIDLGPRSANRARIVTGGVKRKIAEV